jgi:hypothetical protein
MTGVATVTCGGGGSSLVFVSPQPANKKASAATAVTPLSFLASDINGSLE